MSPAQILLFLALTASLTSRVHCQESATEDDQTDDTSDTLSTEETPKPEVTTSVETPDYDSSRASGTVIIQEPKGTELPQQDDSGLSPTIIIVPLLAVLVIICIVVAGVMISRWLRSKSASSDPVQQDAYLDACEGEKVPMPMFEDDVPSVLELEMEDLEKWMVKDGGGSNLNSGPV